jgi:thiol-disulfide isomerase/thioredoxin
MTRTTRRHGGRTAAAVAVAALTLAACGSTASTEAAAPSSEAPTVAASPTASSASAAASSLAASRPAASSSASQSSSAPKPTTGAYVDYDAWQADQAAFAGTDVVLFFAASWCPTCRRADANLTGDPASIPPGLTIVKTDYDSQTELKQRYGVTVQHTFVQVDEQGEALAKWTGSETADAIAGKVV